VRRRNHDTEIGFEIADQKGSSGSGQNPGVVNIDAGARQSCCHRGGKELAGHAWITRYNGEWTPARGTTSIRNSAFAQYDGCCLGKTQGKLYREVVVRNTANTVSAKEPGHLQRLSD